MKTLIATMALVAATSANAFVNDDRSNADGFFGNSGNGEFVGNGTGRGEATFTMSFTGKADMNSDVHGNGNNSTNVYGTGYRTPYYGYTSPYYQK
jgi:hypothetical protein